uniref:Alanine--tRNA ligase n=1 Tax=Albugo laibachii Nc14 TaxID=890382 RepID=F0VZK3_9STRA|nr:unnamed protein product [Albugo laibachii Nc14]|eukprot:CCA14233.1 unnamed protein product [Albugo laibachii Nc14]
MAHDHLHARIHSLEKGLKERETKISSLESAIDKLTVIKSQHHGSPSTVHADREGPSVEWPATRIRETFINYFRKHSFHPHTFYPSCPVIPLDDPTLLFINAGMNQFKPIFLGQVDPNHPMSKLQRAVNSQKCIRAGGKHNDLDDVGKDVYHHTFFEMLGNWSFGDYFKQETIEMSFNLLTKVYQIDAERLYATYFGGDPKQQLLPDEETRAIWLKYLPSSRVLPFGCKDNFWEMGDIGPCGPCTEIHYDRLGNRDAAALVNADVPDVIEIWNNVFIQFNRENSGKLVPLPNKHVDTGMGFERLASILQGKTSNYDTDVFTPLFHTIQSITKAEPYEGKLGAEDANNKDMAYRVVADHIRTLTFAIADGVMPSNDGRGYVLRRILRRAVRYGQQFLNAPKGFLNQLVRVVVDMMHNTFPELKVKQNEVEQAILEEEESFGRTLNKGIEKFRKIVESVQGARDGEKQQAPAISGKDAFFLYDSMGFPLDLTQVMAEEEGMTVDVEGYGEQMKLQSERSKQDRKKGSGDNARPLVLEAQETNALLELGIPTTNDDAKYEWNKALQAKVVAIFTTTDSSCEFVSAVTAQKHDRIGIVLDRTSFYAQAGGQVYDTGSLEKDQPAGTRFNIDAVESYAGYVLHAGTLESGSLQVGDDISCQVDYDRRSKIAPNHTMTHVLNFALRKVLVKNVDQRGSLVDDVRMRFDFTTNKPLSPSQLQAVENMCENSIKQELQVFTKNTSQTDARRIQGLRAVFGETYPDTVRVVSIGQMIDPMLKDPENSTWSNFSVEFCGGTHLENTKQARKFVLYEEGAIARGIRRISAYTGQEALNAEKRGQELQKQLDCIKAMQDSDFIANVTAFRPILDASLISLPLKDHLRKELEVLVDRVKTLKKKEAALRAADAITQAIKQVKEAQEKSTKFVVARMQAGTDVKLGREILAAMSNALPEGSFMVFSTDDDAKKTAAFCQVSQHHADTKQLDARQWVNEAMKPMNGKGGGKSALNANGQAKIMDHIEEAMAIAESYVR